MGRRPVNNLLKKRRTLELSLQLYVAHEVPITTEVAHEVKRVKLTIVEFRGEPLYMNVDLVRPVLVT